MRIIYPGHESVREVKVKCKSCGCEFAYTIEDLHHDQRDGDYVICPWCKKYIKHQYAAYRFW